jgi:formylglycine-generating enzyme required for sulfatase activity
MKRKLRDYSWLVGLLILGSCVGRADAPVLKPLPQNRRIDQYESRDEVLRRAAEFETIRLRTQPWRDDAEEAFFSKDVQEVVLAEGVKLRFVRISASQYLDGITEELKERVLNVRNRSGDLRRWEGMFETARRDKVTVDCDYYLSETIVSNAMFAAFVRETGYLTTVERYATGWVVDKEAQWLQGFANNWRLQVYPMSEPDHPVVQVSWFDAMQFAAWLSRKAGVIFRVPTKEEWLLAARPESMRNEVCLFPWGNSLEGIEKKMNFGTAELSTYAWIHEQYSDGYAYSSPVKAFPPNTRGLYDMQGNVWVWNWTNVAQYDRRPVGDRIARPVRLTELGVDHNETVAMQGGCFLARLSHANLLAKMGHPALDGAEDIGFRLVAVHKADFGL